MSNKVQVYVWENGVEARAFTGASILQRKAADVKKFKVQVKRIAFLGWVNVLLGCGRSDKKYWVMDLSKYLFLSTF